MTRTEKPLINIRKHTMLIQTDTVRFGRAGRVSNEGCVQEIGQSHGRKKQ